MDGQLSEALIRLGAAIVIYLLPTIVAFFRGRRFWRIVLVNLPLGIIPIGWIAIGVWGALLVWSLWPKRREVVYVSVPYDGATYEDLMAQNREEVVHR